MIQTILRIICALLIIILSILMLFLPFIAVYVTDNWYLLFLFSVTWIPSFIILYFGTKCFETDN